MTQGRVADLRRMTRWHALPDNWHEMPYPDFLEARRQLIVAITREGFESLRGSAAASEPVTEAA